MDDYINFYDLLGIDYDADNKKIKDAYRNIIKNYHPDLNQNIPDKYFIKVTHAYDTLINKKKRFRYNQRININSCLDKGNETISKVEKNKDGDSSSPAFGMLMLFFLAYIVLLIFMINPAIILTIILITISKFLFKNIIQD